jgi:hypothetical protein
MPKRPASRDYRVLYEMTSLHVCTMLFVDVLRPLIALLAADDGLRYSHRRRKKPYLSIFHTYSRCMLTRSIAQHLCQQQRQHHTTMPMRLLPPPEPEYPCQPERRLCSTCYRTYSSSVFTRSIICDARLDQQHCLTCTRCLKQYIVAQYEADNIHNIACLHCGTPD